MFHKSWVEYDYEEIDANGWSRVIPLYISDRARDEEGNYFVCTPSMHFQLETGERDSICFQEESTDFPVDVSGGGEGDKSGSNAPPPDETSGNAATSERGGGDGHHVPPLVMVTELVEVKVEVKAEVRAEKIPMKTMKVKSRRRETTKKRRRKKSWKATGLGHCPLVVPILCP